MIKYRLSFSWPEQVIVAIVSMTANETTAELALAPNLVLCAEISNYIAATAENGSRTTMYRENARSIVKPCMLG
jgi:hypothetical protein